MDTLELQLTGEIDLASQDVLDAIVELFDRAPLANLTVNLSEVTFMDSTGLGMLLRLRDIARARGGVVTLTNVRPQVERLLDVSRLGALFETAHRSSRPAMIR